jgi:hypothetical protein
VQGLSRERATGSGLVKASVSLEDPLASSKSKTRVIGKRRSLAPSAPELKIGYKPAGRDTLAAIEEELATPEVRAAEAPVIEITETPAGRDTLAAIEQELTAELRPRRPMLPHGHSISNARGARRPSKAPAPKPQAGLESAPPGQCEPATEALQPASVEIFELLTFIVRGSDVGDLATDALRRRFVEQHLLHRVPGGSLAAVERIEVTPWTTKGTTIVRMWCRA